MTKLQKFFREYNRKYFYNKLVEPTLQWEDIKHFGHYYTKEWETFDVFTEEVVDVRTEHIIGLGAWSKNNNSIWRMTLLHECVHLKLADKKCKTHGRLFNDEMKQLANRGAFNGLW